MHVVSIFLPRRPAPQGLIGGAVSALCQQLGSEPPGRRTVDALIRADIAFLAIELVLLGLLIVNLQTSTESHAAAAALIVSGPYAWAFWGVIVALGILVPLALQGLELGHRIPHTVLPALLVLVGGFALRWVIVNAGQASHVMHAAGL
jgi:formate-dependent nitrite reductase membrane component NrfD